ncbi:MAG: ATP-binding protein [Clostridia bacterium]|nr:ATP-binding protein [Clostridia bacterium]
MEITKIVITGGPCAGKTAAMSHIRDHFSKEGYTVLFVPETASELISGGVAPWTCGTNEDYQVCQMRMQLFKEEIFLAGGSTMPTQRLLLVCDRGAMDNRAYMDDGEFARVLNKLGLEANALRDSYDAVFHLVTAAKGLPQFYTLENNAARIETVEEATALDDRILAAWAGHPHFRLIENSPDFERKISHLLAEIAMFLAEKNS